MSTATATTTATEIATATAAARAASEATTPTTTAEEHQLLHEEEDDDASLSSSLSSCSAVVESEQLAVMRSNCDQLDPMLDDIDCVLRYSFKGSPPELYSPKKEFIYTQPLVENKVKPSTLFLPLPLPSSSSVWCPSWHNSSGALRLVFHGVIRVWVWVWVSVCRALPLLFHEVSIYLFNAGKAKSTKFIARFDRIVSICRVLSFLL